ncbi:hypothetical protein BDZ94DRAFT_1254371 [Collybia nuda]|uniref:Uncharacterized protein n=1 Tax=Collybia nuda TaxID=64659 RepID=A0A9P6CGK3_9AGAR|nr:hypothetical protein BDZ94DRAFT_1254371 [Collybia nuda]
MAQIPPTLSPNRRTDSYGSFPLQVSFDQWPRLPPYIKSLSNRTEHGISSTHPSAPNMSRRSLFQWVSTLPNERSGPHTPWKLVHSTKNQGRGFLQNSLIARSNSILLPCRLQCSSRRHGQPLIYQVQCDSQHIHYPKSNCDVTFIYFLVC